MQCTCDCCGKTIFYTYNQDSCEIVFSEQKVTYLRERKFKHEGRAGGSYTKRIRYEGAFAIIVDEWDNETAIPAEDIAEVKVERGRY